MNSRWEQERKVLPAFPITPHLPFDPNATKDDTVAAFGDVIVNVQYAKRVHIEEKVDGANAGLTIWNNEPLIRNRDHILRKAYQKDTPAKKQFASIWGWWYENRDKFLMLKGLSVYGDWMKARHGIYYNRLPDWFVAYDLYDQDSCRFLAPQVARPLLQRAGFTVPVVRWHASSGDYGCEDKDVLSDVKMIELSRLPSEWSDELSEGIYVKVDDGEFVTHRYKMVRKDYIRGQYWDGKTMLLNEVVKGGKA